MHGLGVLFSKLEDDGIFVDICLISRTRRNGIVLSSLPQIISHLPALQVVLDRSGGSGCRQSMIIQGKGYSMRELDP